MTLSRWSSHSATAVLIRRLEGGVSKRLGESAHDGGRVGDMGRRRLPNVPHGVLDGQELLARDAGLYTGFDAGCYAGFYAGFDAGC